MTGVSDAHAQYVEGFWKREREAEARLRERQQRALEAAHAAARRLFALGARRVVLFGSLAIEGHFREESDIDLLVEGIAPARLEEVEAELRCLDPAFAFDVVPKECASKYLLEWIALHGIELHHRRGKHGRCHGLRHRYPTEVALRRDRSQPSAGVRHRVPDDLARPGRRDVEGPWPRRVSRNRLPKVARGRRDGHARFHHSARRGERLRGRDVRPILYLLAGYELGA